MNDEAESSRAALPYRNDNSAADPDPESLHAGAEHHDDDDDDDDEDTARREQSAKERRIDAKRKRVVFLDHLLRELDTFVFLELITLYHLDCSFFWFTCRALIQLTLLTPLPDLALARQYDEHKPFLPLMLVSFSLNFLLHLLYSAPSAGEDTRGYLHGGLMIDFIGQLGPTSKWKLVGLDTAILLLQLVMVSVHVKRRELKKKLAKISGGTSASRSAEGDSTTPEGLNTRPTNTNTNDTNNTDRDQDADAEERGILRRTDTLSDIGTDHDEEDALLPPSSETGHTDALDALASGQCLVGDFHLIDTLLQEHENYTTFRQTRSETAAGSSSLSPDTLRQLHTIRMTFGVGGG
ncbi:DUF1746-domain-containing protein [Lindgomyces ingoldianus]|uniref:DUF1746-domain-containing protein n=1 Tax=Lindgomyces ingoldianus TaxID=673940 RepID=A0ACB6RC23_9PLEO|nr:DUF1746-domain-containing protein [Lindgomyces ingoldianus]KAF2476731.1 DUF1746-domain-containing protein [Lindgomyces ingoldianus]